jgi:molybdopterin-guanine dinucleotide biosynthesis protein B
VHASTHPGPTMASLPPIVTFAAPSGTGKTTLLEGVVRALVARGLRIGVVKHDAHRLKLDTPGKDSWRLRQAGAYRVVVASHDQIGVFAHSEGDSSLVGLVGAQLADMDLVLTEGFRRSTLPSLRVHRAAARVDEAWIGPEQVIAWVSDTPLERDVPVLPLEDPEAVASFIATTFLTPNSAATRCTLVVPLARDQDAAALAPLLTDPVWEGRVLAITSPHGPRPKVPWVVDLRPGDGVLGALLTGLAAANTPDILFVGPRHASAPMPLLQGLIKASAQERSALTVPFTARGPEPLCAVYGHGCLPAIHDALLSGERRMTGWWGPLRVRRVQPETWGPWDPQGLAFPA